MGRLGFPIVIYALRLFLLTPRMKERPKTEVCHSYARRKEGESFLKLHLECGICPIRPQQMAYPKIYEMGKNHSCMKKRVVNNFDAH